MTNAEKYVAAAYLVVFVVVLAYVLIIAAKLERLEREVAELTGDEVSAVRLHQLNLDIPFRAKTEQLYLQTSEGPKGTAGKTMPLDNIHRIEEPGFATRTATHAEIHNIVGLENARATYEGLLKLRPNERPFVLTRATFAGFPSSPPVASSTTTCATSPRNSRD